MAILLGIFDPDVIEAALGHKDTNTMRHAYDQVTHQEQRVKLLQNWANLVEQFAWRKKPDALRTTSL